MILLTRAVKNRVWSRVLENCSPLLSNYSLSPYCLIAPKSEVKCPSISTPSLIQVGTCRQLSLALPSKVLSLLKKALLMQKAEQMKKGFFWYVAVERVDYNEFLIKLNIPDTFNSWFKITELHVWMLLARFMQEGYDTKCVRTSLIEQMWYNTELKAKTLVKSNPNFKNNMSQLNNGFKKALLCYDEGFLKDDKTLSNILWKHFFDKNCDDPRKLETLVSYIRFQFQELQLKDTINMNEEDIIKFNWTSLTSHCKL